MLAFGAVHTLLGLAVFGFIAWLMLGKGEDEAGGTDDGGGGGLRPRPWRPGPARPRMRRGPVRVPHSTRPRSPVVRTPR